METTMQGIRFWDITPTMENQMEKKSNRHGHQHCSYAACIYVPVVVTRGLLGCRSLAKP